MTRTRTTTGPSVRRDQRGPAGPAGLGPGRPSRPTAVPAPRRRPEGPAYRPAQAPVRVTPHALFAERLLAVLSGRRPVHWMLNHSIGDGYQQLVELAPGAPFRTTGARPVVRTCRAHPLRPGVVEASACIAAGDHVRAIAFRLERGPDLRWRCAALELDGTNGSRRGPRP